MNEQLNLEYSRLEEKLRETSELEKQLRTTRSEIRKEMAAIRREKYPKIWVVLSDPQDKYHIPHDSGWFVEEDDARANCSRFYSDGIWWVRTAREEDSANIVDGTLLDELMV